MVSLARARPPIPPHTTVYTRTWYSGTLGTDAFRKNVIELGKKQFRKYWLNKKQNSSLIKGTVPREKHNVLPCKEQFFTIVLLIYKTSVQVSLNLL